MSKIKKFLLGTCSMLVLICCSKQPQVADVPIGLESAGFSGHESRALVDPQAGSFFVRENDLQAYLKYKRLADKKEYKDVVIDPVVDQQGDTVMYAINYPSAGWELIAADKRCPIVLGSDVEGSFNYEELIPPIKDWLLGISDEVKSIRAIGSYDEVKNDDVVLKMQNSERFWKMITADTDYLREMGHPTKSGLDPIPYGDGHWECYDTVIDTVGYQLVNHLVQTHWHQGYPYNSYCPYKSYSNTERTPAGCVAIATAQVANYLHDLNGYPDTAPLSAFCDAYVPYYSSDGRTYYYAPSSPDPHMYVSNLSSSAWDDIPSDGDMCAKLVAEVGLAVGMRYYDSVSLSSELGASYLGNKGYYYSLGFTFNYDAVIDNVTSGMPVIAGAYDPDEGGHAFIIDAYKYVRERMTLYYVWVPDDPVPWTPPTTYEEIFTTSQFYSMNWGFGPAHDNAWYSMYANWPVNGFTFVTSNRQMIYNIGTFLQ